MRACSTPTATRQLLASTNPAVVAYDPAWAYEIAVIVRTACAACTGRARSTRTARTSSTTSRSTTSRTSSRRCPRTARGRAELEQAILAGLYRYAPAAGEPDTERPRAQILASGVGVRWALEAQRLLAEDWDVAADVWSATSWTELRRDALASEECNLLHPDERAARART